MYSNMSTIKRLVEIVFEEELEEKLARFDKALSNKKYISRLWV